MSLKDLCPCPVPPCPAPPCPVHPQQVGTPGPPQVATPAQQVVTPIPNTPVTRENITHTDNGDTATEAANTPQINNDAAPDIHNFVRRSVRVTRPLPRLAYE